MGNNPSPRRPVARAAPGEKAGPSGLTDIRCAGPELRVWILSPSLVTVVTHFSAERTGPCFRVSPEAECAHCQAGVKRIAQSWLQAVLQGDNPWTPRMCHLTPCAVGFEPRLVELDGALHGRELRLWRQPKHARGRMYSLLSGKESKVTLPDCRDAYVTLCMMWAAPIRRIKMGSAKPEDQIDADPYRVDGIIDWRG